METKQGRKKKWETDCLQHHRRGTTISERNKEGDQEKICKPRRLTLPMLFVDAKEYTKRQAYTGALVLSASIFQTLHFLKSLGFNAIAYAAVSSLFQTVHSKHHLNVAASTAVPPLFQAAILSMCTDISANAAEEIIYFKNYVLCFIILCLFYKPLFYISIVNFLVKNFYNITSKFLIENFFCEYLSVILYLLVLITLYKNKMFYAYILYLHLRVK
jgi:hypothetical protein